MATYDVTVTREGRWWMIEIPAIDGLTQARRLNEVTAMATSYISVSQDVEPSTIDVNITHIYVDGIDALTTKTDLAAARAAAEKAEREAQEAAATAANELARRGVTLRDVADIVGVSFQRVGQLVTR